MNAINERTRPLEPAPVFRSLSGLHPNHRDLAQEFRVDDIRLALAHDLQIHPDVYAPEMSHVRQGARDLDCAPAKVRS
jgi:hypothetical protein